MGLTYQVWWFIKVEHRFSLDTKFVIDSIYLFGGLEESGNGTNDLWKFSFST